MKETTILPALYKVSAALKAGCPEAEDLVLSREGPYCLMRCTLGSWAGLECRVHTGTGLVSLRCETHPPEQEEDALRELGAELTEQMAEGVQYRICDGVLLFLQWVHALPEEGPLPSEEESSEAIFHTVSEFVSSLLLACPRLGGPRESVILSWENLDLPEGAFGAGRGESPDSPAPEEDGAPAGAPERDLLAQVRAMEEAISSEIDPGETPSSSSAGLLPPELEEPAYPWGEPDPDRRLEDGLDLMRQLSDRAQSTLEILRAATRDTVVLFQERRDSLTQWVGKAREREQAMTYREAEMAAREAQFLKRETVLEEQIARERDRADRAEAELKQAREDRSEERTVRLEEQLRSSRDLLRSLREHQESSEAEYERRLQALSCQLEEERDRQEARAEEALEQARLARERAEEDLARFRDRETPEGVARRMTQALGSLGIMMTPTAGESPALLEGRREQYTVYADGAQRVILVTREIRTLKKFTAHQTQLNERSLFTAWTVTDHTLKCRLFCPDPDLDQTASLVTQILDEMDTYT